MTIVDRYQARLFLKVLLISYFSLGGLSLIIDVFANTDEFVDYSKKQGISVLWDYYGPRMLWFFDRTTGLLALGSAIFAVTLMQRSSEMTALLAAGISPARIVKPLLVGAVLVSLLGAANRELGLPAVRDQLVRNWQDWNGAAARKCTPRYDIKTDVLISGKSTIARERRIQEPVFRLPPELNGWGRQIAAAHAVQLPADQNHPAGYLLQGVTQPADLPALKSESLGGERVLISPADAPWLKPDECFVVSVVDFQQLTAGNGWRQYLSTWEILRGLKNQTIEAGADVRFTLHSRLVQPLLDISLVLLGVPLVLTRGNRNIFFVGGASVLLVAALYVLVLICKALGLHYLISSTLAAWLPLLVFGPLAYVLARQMWD